MSSIFSAIMFLKLTALASIASAEELIVSPSLVYIKGVASKSEPWTLEYIWQLTTDEWWKVKRHSLTLYFISIYF